MRVGQYACRRRMLPSPEPPASPTPSVKTPMTTRAGFHERGPLFDEASIAHVEMVRSL